VIFDWLKGIALLRFPEVRRGLGRLRLKWLQVQTIRNDHPGIKIDDGVECIAYRPERFIVGEKVSICNGTVLAFGDNLNGFGRIEIGSHTWIGQYNNLRVCDGGNLLIGSHCLISQFCTLIGSNHSIYKGELIQSQGIDRTKLGIIIGDDVWLGAGVTVTPGVQICEGAVIGANAVVTRSVPAYEIWAGCPARKVGERK
jgi:acetyltransferase-like isoleucine patch superfamily enzyme